MLQVKFPSLEYMEQVDLREVTDIWGKHSYNDIASSFDKLKRLEVSRCYQQQTVVPRATLKIMFPHLETWEHEDEYIIDSNEEEKDDDDDDDGDNIESSEEEDGNNIESNKEDDD